MRVKHFAAFLAIWPTLGVADVKSDRLSLIDTSFVTASMKTYFLDGTVHSVLIEAKTDYPVGLKRGGHVIQQPIEKAVKGRAWLALWKNIGKGVGRGDHAA